MTPHSNRSKKSPKAGREPRPEELLVFRQRSGLTQAQAADLIYTSPRNWQNWEQGSDGRSMPASAFELFMLKTGQFTFEEMLVATDVATTGAQLPVLLRVRLDNGAVLELLMPPAKFASLASGIAPRIAPMK